MEKDLVQKQIKETLEKMGCTDILFKDLDTDSFYATFNSKELTSFVADTDGWKYSGIQLDSSKERQFKIEFKKS